MKKCLLCGTMLFSTIVFLNSCATTNKESLIQRKNDIEKSKESSAGCFIRLTDGTIRTYKTLDLVTGIFTNPHLLGDGKDIITASSITAYQNKTHYAVSQADFKSGHRSYISVETLPGFAIRVAKGKVNVYTKKYYNGRCAVDEFFIQTENDAPVVACSDDIMNDLLKNDPEAFDLVYSKKYMGYKTRKQSSPAPTGNDMIVSKK